MSEERAPWADEDHPVRRDRRRRAPSGPARPRTGEVIGMTGYDLGAPWPGMLTHHNADCPARLGRPCTCGPAGYRAVVDDGRRETPVLGPVLPTLDEARLWQHEQHAAVTAFQASAPPSQTVSDVVDEFLDAAREGAAIDGQGQPYTADQLRDLRWSLRGYVASELGEMRIADLHGAELRAFVGRLDAEGLSRARTRAVVRALRALMRHAAQRGMVPRSAADLLVFGDTDELPQAAPPAQAPPAQMPYGDPYQQQQYGQPQYGQPPYEPQQYQQQPQQSPTMPSLPRMPAAMSGGAVPDEVIWMVLKIVSLVFILIALVLVAESV